MTGVSLSEIVERIRIASVQDLRDFAPACHAAVAAFFADALHRTPDRRPRTAAEFARYLEAVRLSVSTR